MAVRGWSHTGAVTESQAHVVAIAGVMRCPQSDYDESLNEPLWTHLFLCI